MQVKFVLIKEIWKQDIHCHVVPKLWKFSVVISGKHQSCDLQNALLTIDMWVYRKYPDIFTYVATAAKTCWANGCPASSRAHQERQRIFSPLTCTCHWTKSKFNLFTSYIILRPYARDKFGRINVKIDPFLMHLNFILFHLQPNPSDE